MAAELSLSESGLTESLRGCEYRSRAVRRVTLERRRDRYGPARARPSLWAGHKAAEAKLLASGHAYRDFARPEEFDEERKVAQVAGKPYLSSRRFAAFDDETARRFEAEGRQSVVRLKMPRDGALVIEDKVRGRVKFAWEREQDHVIQRVDGSCLYHLASVVDDHGLAMTHVIRAEEHLSNTPRQAFIALSLGYELPTSAHLPLVAEPGSRTKLSKRKLTLMLPLLVKAKLFSDPPSAEAVTMAGRGRRARGGASREGSRAGLLGAAPTGARCIPPLIIPAHAPCRFSRCRVMASRALR